MKSTEFARILSKQQSRLNQAFFTLYAAFEMLKPYGEDATHTSWGWVTDFSEYVYVGGAEYSPLFVISRAVETDLKSEFYAQSYLLNTENVSFSKHSAHTAWGWVKALAIRTDWGQCSLPPLLQPMSLDWAPSDLQNGSLSSHRLCGTLICYESCTLSCLFITRFYFAFSRFCSTVFFLMHRLTNVRTHFTR